MAARISEVSEDHLHGQADVQTEARDAAFGEPMAQKNIRRPRLM
jgi:hypothetical protein